MRLCLSGLLFLLVISLPSGNGFLRNDGVEIRSCTVIGGRCFFGCRVGWEWVAYCHNILSCCKKLKTVPSVSGF
ncbi:defensin beta 136 [Rhinolophus ferrumequinum]|uniref:Defensin beta 136 n=1 Tax=Rhinolophus ferrumequinum TaxID=59479 RepID=A0A7J7TZS2_RHIFE|nr:defensin beta 136 [Rhinolophus ferrumequinum]KAF6306066.1 defensin beta 136 [Rhinolophus ferrumequinum]